MAIAVIAARMTVEPCRQSSMTRAGKTVSRSYAKSSTIRRLFTLACHPAGQGPARENLLAQFGRHLRIFEQEGPRLFLALPQVSFAIFEPGATARKNLL